MKKILFVVVSLSLNMAFADNTRKINVVCSGSQCFKKIEDAYAKLECDLKLISSQVVHYERSFPANDSTFRTYELSQNCKKAIFARTKISHAADEGEMSKPSCMEGFDLRNVQVENQNSFVCRQKITQGWIKPQIRSVKPAN